MNSCKRKLKIYKDKLIRNNQDLMKSLNNKRMNIQLNWNKNQKEHKRRKLQQKPNMKR